MDKQLNNNVPSNFTLGGNNVPSNFTLGGKNGITPDQKALSGRAITPDQKALTGRAIIALLAKQRVIEQLVQSLTQSPYKDDLCQDLYVDLLNKDENLITGMYYRGELLYFIRRMVSNNINSTTSPFYQKYERFRNLSTDLNDINDEPAV